jgi:hypothetical protein
LSHLGHELRRNYITPSEITVVLQSLGAERLAEHIRANKLPTKVGIRHGEFGEVLGGALYRVAKRYCLPILKLRYKQGPNQPAHLADILAFRLSAQPPVVAVLEVKTRVERRLGIGVEAYDQLAETIRGGLGQALSFTIARLADQNPTLATRIARLFEEPRVIERHVILVHDDSTWKEEIVARLEKAVKANRTQAIAVVIRLPSLPDLVEGSYRAASEDLVKHA